MLKSDLQVLIDQGEGAKLEFKRDDVRPEDLAREIVAFANMNGGQILLGVEDDGNISGIQRPTLQAWLMDTVIGRYVTPYIHPDYEEVSLDDKKVAIVTIPRGAGKPYARKHKDREDIYVRYGNTCQLADRQQQARLFSSGGLVSVEKFPVPGAKLKELSKPRYEQYLGEILNEGKIDDTLLTNRGFLVNENNKLFSSYFAYVLFAKKPGLRLPQATVRVTVYPGLDKNYNTTLDETLDIPYVELRDDSGDAVEPAMHEKIIETINPHISREEMVSATRKRVWDYPKDAIREAVVNALIHRDWTKPDYVRVVVYSDRLEVKSPGALPNGMTIEKIKSGSQLSRNQEFVRIFRNYGYLEDQGMGIRRKIIPLCEEHGCSADFEATEDHFKVILHKGND